MSRQRGAVLITAGASGIGAACVKLLNQQGFWVFAGVRDMAQGEPLHTQLSNPQRFTPILLDVTQQTLVEAAVDQVIHLLAAQEIPLVGIVNNHTREHHGPLEILPLALIRQEMEVDYFGTLRVIQSFLPLLRQHRGRIVNFSSINGRFVFMSIGASCAAKYAVEAMSDTLRLELAPWQIHVALIEPGATKTPLWDKGQRALEDLPSHISAEKLQRYYPNWPAVVQSARENTATFYGMAQSPYRVAQAVLHALTSHNPKTRYVAAQPVEKLLLLGKWLLPDRWFDRLAMRVFNDQVGAK